MSHGAGFPRGAASSKPNLINGEGGEERGSELCQARGSPCSLPLSVLSSCCKHLRRGLARGLGWYMVVGAAVMALMAFLGGFHPIACCGGRADPCSWTSLWWLGWMGGGRLDALSQGRARQKEFGLDFGVMEQPLLLPGASLLCCERGTGLWWKGPSGRRCLHLLFPVGKQQRASDHFPGLFSQLLGEGKCSVEHLAVAPSIFPWEHNLSPWILWDFIGFLMHRTHPR